MQSSNEQVLHTLQEWLTAGHFCWLISIAATWGSSPRPAGSLLVWCRQHGAVGSLSGGCIEDALLEKLAQEDFDRSKIHVETYGVSADDATRLRLPCGGTMRLVLEPMPATQAYQHHATEMVARLQQRQGFTRTVHFTQQQPADIATTTASHCELTTDYFRNYLGPRHRLLLVGANQVSEFLAEFARSLDFDVLICDPRPGAFDHWPHAFTHTFDSMPDDIVREHASDCRSAVVTVAHDPRVDDMALMEALTTDAFYVGAMGSRRSTDNRLQRLQQLALTPAQLARLHAPVGLAIGSKTPAEIALSIAADLVRHTRQKTGNTCPDV